MSSSVKSSSSSNEVVEMLDRHRGKIISKTGGWRVGKGVFSHGYSLFEELVGEKSYMQIVVLNATGKLIDRDLADWIEAVYGCLSWPDPRIWCNQIGALAGTARTSVMAATAMGALAADSTMYGVLPIKDCAEFIRNALMKNQQGCAANEIVDSMPSRRGKPVIVGYARPIANGDERIEVMERVRKKLAFKRGAHLMLAYDIERVIMQKCGERMNIGGYVAAFLSDHNFSSQELYQLFSMIVSSGVTACYLESYKRPPDTFLPLRCEDIDYRGLAARAMPRD